MKALALYNLEVHKVRRSSSWWRVCGSDGLMSSACQKGNSLASDWQAAACVHWNAWTV
jgi:hypothetical protein